MRSNARRHRVLRASASLSLGLLLGSAGCTYLGWTVEKKHLRREARNDPGLGLAREAAPENCFQLVGRVTRPAGWTAPLLVAAVAREAKGPELVASREILSEAGYYTLLLPAGTYDLFLLADRDGNGVYESAEAAGRTPVESPVEVGLSASKDGFLLDGPELPVAAGPVQEPSLSLRITRTPRSNVVASLDDPMCDPKRGEVGMYRPTRLLAATQGLVFGLGDFQPGKTMVLFVHGIDGTPRDFKVLAAGLDTSRYQPWFFYYPSGMPLDKLGMILARVIQAFGTDLSFDVPRLVVVAHSMGGLVSRRALNDLCANGRPGFLLGYVSFSSPYGGTGSAAKGVRQAPEVVPAWRDLATGSDFVARLHRTPLPADLPFHLFFGWGKKGDDGPSPAGDGVIEVRSQLDPRAQKSATRIHGFEESHVGILENAEAGRTFYAVLDSLAGPKAP